MDKNKKGMELAIPLLVLMALVLSSLALVIFNINSNRVSSKIGDYALLDSINIKEKQINFYVNDIVENSISGIQKGRDVRNQFIDNFKKELKRYKNGDSFYVKELEQLESQLNRDKIKIEDTGQKSLLDFSPVSSSPKQTEGLDDKKISIIFKIEIGKEFPDRMTLIYSYEKEFYGFLS